jgi:ribosomal protein S18 acetylase RimI-like enzyme
MTLVVPATPAQWREARRLVEEYAASLGIDLAFQDFTNELASFETEYAPPHGAFFLAEHDGAFVGCGAFRRLSDGVCEMKRLYVAPPGRGRGIGRALAVRLIDDARARGYSAIRLDTLPTMIAARQMYAELGFREIEPYRYNPVEGTAFMELRF